jgi:perosamine synthetase
MIPLSEPTLGQHELEYITRCIATKWISANGEYVWRMEEILAEYIGVKHAVACNCGTSAIHISLMLSGVKPGDEVIVPAVTFIAPVNAVRYVDAWPVFIDCDQYCNLDVEALRRFLTEECAVQNARTINRSSGRRLAAIVPVHVFGTSVDMDPLLEMAAEYGLAVVEDASESLGSLYKGRKCGGLAAVGCLSFNGNKIVTTGGGGAILTNDDAIARQARYLTTQAKEDGVEYIHNAIGYNYRMNNVLAAIGLAQLETLEERIATKHTNFALYEQSLGPERLVQQPAWSEANRWFYGFLCSSPQTKARLMATCANADVQVRPLWYPNHLQKPYQSMQAYQITNAPRFYDTLLNLPCSLSLTREQIAEVVALIDETDPRPQAPPA